MQATGSERFLICIFYANHLVGPRPPPPQHHLLAMAFVSRACSLALSWATQGHTPWLFERRGPFLPAFIHVTLPLVSRGVGHVGLAAKGLVSSS